MHLSRDKRCRWNCRAQTRRPNKQNEHFDLTGLAVARMLSHYQNENEGEREKRAKERRKNESISREGESALREMSPVNSLTFLPGFLSFSLFLFKADTFSTVHTREPISHRLSRRNPINSALNSLISFSNLQRHRGRL